MIRIRATREGTSAPSAASATDLHHDPPTLNWSARMRSSRTLSRPTMLTVLTQIALFISGDSEWTYGHPDEPSGGLSSRILPTTTPPHAAQRECASSPMRISLERLSLLLRPPDTTLFGSG